ncbi:MAG: DUF547 domain-containing protein [Alphaproteobacteria bacterium]|nr:DUF547 domain-containing protein [Alphaproteobacteria bacterium]MDA8004757.1 DUF547 domain-containing protein [Alphaproteobacteria bacterium]MDA8006510.1 DUF547 domain-containing protein [Alphaproteobacteria bacterium]MDA8013922.1 DUF547 domain-containing protein [Alphaproteobacteria bacterium]
MIRRRHFLQSAVAVAALPALAAFRSASDSRAPKSELWPVWQTHNPDAAPSAEPDYQTLARLLDKYLAPPDDALRLARFNYNEVSAQEGDELVRFNQELGAVNVNDLNKNQQFTFWTNLYNSLTLQVVLQHWPVDSIRDINISPGLFARGPWNAEVVTVLDENLTLNDIEHRILRPIWNDARIHYAVNCASVGCPNLQLWNSQTLERDLDAAAAQFVNSPRGVDIQSREVTVSKIYSWYVEDFDSDEQGVLRHLRRYAQPRLDSDLAEINQLHDSDYDWNINSA